MELELETRIENELKIWEEAYLNGTLLVDNNEWEDVGEDVDDGMDEGVNFDGEIGMKDDV